MLDYINRFRIGARIAAAVMIPIVALVSFGAFQEYQLWQDANRMDRLQKLVRLAPTLSELVHELQKERGMSAGFIGSKGSNFAEELPAQWLSTDARHQELSDSLAASSFGDHAAELGAQIERAQESLADLETLRGRVTAFDVPIPEMAKFYTGTIASLLNAITAMEHLTHNAEVLNGIAAYSAFLQAKERAGLERAMGSAGFGSGAFSLPIYRKFVQLLAEQEVLFKVMAEHSTEDQVRFFEETITGPAVDEVERMRGIASESIATGDTGGIEGPYWFQTITKKIELMKIVEDRFSSDLLSRLDELQGEARSSLIQLAAIFAVLLILSAVLCSIIVRGITRPLSAATTAIKGLASGDTSVEIDQRSRADEIGDIQSALVVFRDNMIEMDRLRADQERAKERAEAERKEAVMALADGFEGSVKVVVESVAQASEEVRAMAETAAANANDTQSRAGSVSAAAEQASGNVNTVASATEELNASVSEIGRQVQRASEIAAEGARQAGQTDHEVAGLVEAAERIGEVVSLIADIAEQTNLLALNATIEAARAGEAGKGFAVVASEVKSLANQTAKATDDISQQVSSIQQATSSAAEAIRAIGSTVGEINEIATAIASAMEEQGAATQEIARNVQEAAQGTQEVTSNITSVSNSAEEAGQAAGGMAEAARDLSKQSQTLATEVDNFVAKVRAA